MSKYDTKQRTVLLNFFREHLHESFSAQEIYEAVKSDGISLSAVYRNISLLEESKEIRKINKKGNRTVFYQYVASDCCKGRIHLMCKQCGGISHLDTELTNHLCEHIINDKNFLLDQSETVIYGVCKTCQDK